MNFGPLTAKTGPTFSPTLPKLCVFHNLTATLRAYISGKTHDIDNHELHFTTTRGLLHRPKTTRTLVHKWFQTRPALLLTIRKFRFHFIARLRRRTSANGAQQNFCQTVDSKFY